MNFVKCPKCAAMLRYPEGATIKVVKCPRCKTRFPIDHGAPTPPAATKRLALSGGTEFGGLRIVRPLGIGGMAEVYLAMQLSLNRSVAVKIFPDWIENTPDALARFDREARALAELNHPNIISVIDRGITETGRHYIVMNYIEGSSLRDMMNKGDIDADKTVKIILSVCDALQHAHKHDIIHRDLKPSNILIGPEGRAHVADFGLARLVGEHVQDTAMTMTNVGMGTRGYMAPEQMISARDVDHRVDIYSTGVILYELIARQLPMGAFSPPSGIRPEFMYNFDDVVTKALQPKPGDRFDSAEQMAKVIRHAKDSQKPRKLKPTKKAAKKSEKKLNPAAIWVGSIIAAVVLIIALAILANRGPKKEPEPTTPTTPQFVAKPPVEEKAESPPTPAAPQPKAPIANPKTLARIKELLEGIGNDTKSAEIASRLKQLDALIAELKTGESRKLVDEAKQKFNEILKIRFNEISGRAQKLAGEGKYEEAKRLLNEAKSGDFASLERDITSQLQLIGRWETAARQKKEEDREEKAKYVTVYPILQVPRFLKDVKDDDFEPLKITSARLKHRSGYIIDFDNFRPVTMEAKPYSMTLAPGGYVEIACNGVVILSRFCVQVRSKKGDQITPFRKLSGSIRRRGTLWTLRIDESWEGRKIKTSVYELTRVGVTAHFQVDLSSRPQTEAFVLAMIATDGLGSAKEIKITATGKPALSIDPAKTDQFIICMAKRMRVTGKAGFIDLTKPTGRSEFGFWQNIKAGYPLLFHGDIPFEAKGSKKKYGEYNLNIKASVKGSLPLQREMFAAMPDIKKFLKGLKALKRTQYPRDLSGPWSVGQFTIYENRPLCWKGKPLLSGGWPGKLVAVEYLTDGVSLEFERKVGGSILIEHTFITVTPKGVLYTARTEAGPFNSYAEIDIPELGTSVDIQGRPFEDQFVLYARKWNGLFRVYPPARWTDIIRCHCLIGGIFDTSKGRLKVASRFKSNLGTMRPPGLIHPRAGQLTFAALDPCLAIAGIRIKTHTDILFVPEEK